ncbi:MAG: ATP-binding protein [Sphaerotilus natans subsp. sulfidivorans]|uniref:AAA family ATPase n=1 Tax=Sphaerotilus sulfidivorans TaxID=639200 RepID=UPI0023576292|nr:AAA family ATPase [Sphaerotilus sulfidivorans]MCK6401060.1 ATP-binding protein [Sphaerotilus sulfidivorans]
MTKLTNRFSPSQLTVPPWAVYAECSEVIGQILGNDFDREHHEPVYEHVRYSVGDYLVRPDDVHGMEDGIPGLDDEEADREQRWIDALHEEEFDVYRAMMLNERHKRLNVIGDVGVGKSTFIQHLLNQHLGRDGYPGQIAIYVDWSDFNSDKADPTADIQKCFVSRVLDQLEKKKGRDALNGRNLEIFESAEMFSAARVVHDALPEVDRQKFVAQSIADVMAECPLEFVHARLDLLCRDDPNAVVLIVDNIDHLPASTLSAMFRFLTALQVRARPLLIVGMRDHTYLQGRSAYTPDRIAMAWRMRLNPPNLRGLIQRRIDYFFADRFDDLVASRFDPRRGSVRQGDAMLRRVQIGGMKHMNLDLKQVCRRLLDSTIPDGDTREFMFSYSNYNIRDLFANLQRILNCPGYGAFDARIVLGQTFHLGIDQCVIALTLDHYLMFFPEKSSLFNPYSAGNDVEPTDKLVGVRLLQMLKPLQRPMRYSDLLDCFERWGYRGAAVRTQMDALVHKDLVRTTTGAPADFHEQSSVMLSPRGQLYINRLLGRAVFNYMMSFDVDLDLVEGSPIHRASRSEIREELEALAYFDRPVQVDALAERVLVLAETLYNAERFELKALTSAHSVRAFRAEVAPCCIAAEVVTGLQKFMVAVVERKLAESRFVQPTSLMMQRVAKASRDYGEAFKSVW